MTCQNCGKNEVNFHYSSNINGCITEMNLCAQCATTTGYDLKHMYESGRFFNSFSTTEFFPVIFPMMGIGAGIRRKTPEGARIAEYDRASGCECGKIAPETANTEIDDDMRKRREINMIREQMRTAAENDDFEKAIELREKIKVMEAYQEREQNVPQTGENAMGE